MDKTHTVLQGKTINKEKSLSQNYKCQRNKVSMKPKMKGQFN